MSQSANTTRIPTPAPQNEAEREFMECMRNGRKCALGKSVPDKSDNTNIISTDLIRFFALGGNEVCGVQGNTIYLQGAWIPEELNLSRENIKYAMEFPLCHFDRNVKMEQAQCTALYFDGAHLKKGFEGEGIRIKDDLCFRQKTLDGRAPMPFVTEGEIQLAGAKVGGNLDCHFGWLLVRQSASVLSADGMKIGGCLYLIDSSISGTVNMNGATVGALECRATNFNGSKINITRANIKDSIVLLDLLGSGMFRLDFSETKRVVRDEVSCGKFKFSLRGFVYHDFVAVGESISPGSIQFLIIDWLNHHSGGSNFSPQPFEQAARVLFAIGHNHDARKVLLEKERLLTEKGQFGKWHKRLRWCWDKLAGYGYEWWRTLGAAAIVIGLGWAVFAAANYFGHIVPHQPVVVAKLEKETQKGHECTKHRPTEAAVCLLPQYPRFDALAYSADVFIPFFALHQEPYWYPQPRDKDNYDARFFLVVWLWFEIIAGWVLTSLFVLTITGLLKPRQSSLE